ncbi:lysoplasmalogenase [Trinickia dinghuensis]|uniref:Lysoplasmalogenase n=2 Tax=Trinickia dinghuensis TaxID=2291023 RepID=A0A3D8K4W0_9BURK|nr:lysoplasmalogenase [Trinickia dinghuensis]
MPAGQNDPNDPDGNESGGSDRSDDHTAAIESAASQTGRLLLIAAGAGLAYGISLRDAPYPDQAAAKVLMCGLLFLACARHEPIGERVRLMAALAASAVGDALLALPQLTFSFVGGLGAFLVAHLAYCAVLAPRALGTGLWRGAEAWRRAAIGLLWAAAVAMYVVFLPHLDALAIPVAVYMLALCAMASFALLARPSGPAQRRAGLALPLGGLAFVASDAMIGVDRFLSPFPGSDYAIWFSYAIAQVSIATGILLSNDD